MGSSFFFKPNACEVLYMLCSNPAGLHCTYPIQPNLNLPSVKHPPSCSQIGKARGFCARTGILRKLPLLIEFKINKEHGKPVSRSLLITRILNLSRMISIDALVLCNVRTVFFYGGNCIPP